MSPDPKEWKKAQENFMERVNKLMSDGYDHIQATSIVLLEDRINGWPKEWGNNLQIIIYGDFKPPKKTIEVLS